MRKEAQRRGERREGGSRGQARHVSPPCHALSPPPCIKPDGERMGIE